jgi:hypothetical protein
MKRSIAIALAIGAILVSACAYNGSSSPCCAAGTGGSAARDASPPSLSAGPDSLLDIEISSKRELATLFALDLGAAEREALVGIWLPVHTQERETTEQLLKLRNEIHILTHAVSLDQSRLGAIHDDVHILNRALLDTNMDAIVKMREVVSADVSSGRAQTRAGGDLPMMDKVMYCIDFCAGQVDVICDGGADLKCWHKRFLQCVGFCY